MTQTELVKLIAKKCKVTQTTASLMCKAFQECIIQEMKGKGKITLQGFGTIERIYKPERKGRNPQTGKDMVIPAHNVVKFRPGKKMKDAIGVSK